MAMINEKIQLDFTEEGLRKKIDRKSIKCTV